METWIKKIILIFVLYLLTSIAQAAQIIRYVDPDAAGAGTGLDWTNAYNSLGVWEAAEQQDLTDGGGDYMTVYCRSSKGTWDTPFVLNGWTVGENNYIEIIGVDFPSNGVFDGTKYVLHNNDQAQSLISLNVNYVRFINLQMQVTTTGTNSRYGILMPSGGIETSDIRIDSCIIKGVCSGTGAANAIYSNDSSVTLKLYNSIIYDFVSGDDTGFYGLYIVTCTNFAIYNCTVYNCYTGIRRSAGTVIAANCAVGNNTDDFSGTITINNCCSDDGDGNNPQGPLGGNWANEFTTPGTNFSLLAGGNCVGKGTDDPGAGLYSDDIIGTARTSIWDIGAFEYIAPAGGNSQVIIVEEL